MQEAKMLTTKVGRQEARKKKRTEMEIKPAMRMRKARKKDRKKRLTIHQTTQKKK